ncbi:hypothetical protein HYU50_01570 [Candidatus Woesearchaeota archaeon]|nr:hypothetical protein [Candidatus Woesearchaeota archaeon]
MKGEHNWEKFFENLGKTKSLKTAFSAYMVVCFLLVIILSVKANKLIFFFVLVFYLVFTITWAVFIIKLDKSIKQGLVDFQHYNFHNKVCNRFALIIIIALFSQLIITARLSKLALPEMNTTIVTMYLSVIFGFAVFAIIYYHYFLKPRIHVKNSLV